jgi:hypothetical protein
MEPIVAEIIGLIEAGVDDPRLRWSPDRRMVQVVFSRLVLESGPRPAAAGRRVPFGEEWQAAMAERGWVPGGEPGLFARPAAAPAAEGRRPDDR